MKSKRKLFLWIAAVVLTIVAIPVILFGKRYYDSRYVLDDYFYTIVPLDYDITPYMDQGGRLTDYTLLCYNADGVDRVLSFSVLIDSHNSDLYPPGTFLRVGTSKQIVIGRRAVDVSDVPELALERIKVGFVGSSASSLSEYAVERGGYLAALNTDSLSVSCVVDGDSLIYTYVYSLYAEVLAEASVELLDPVYSAQFRTDRDAFPGLVAIVLEVKLSDGTVVFSQRYDVRISFDYENE